MFKMENSRGGHPSSRMPPNTLSRCLVYASFCWLCISGFKDTNIRLNNQKNQRFFHYNMHNTLKLRTSLDNKSKKIAFCFVLCSLIRTFAFEHWHDVQVRTPVWLLWVKYNSISWLFGISWNLGNFIEWTTDDWSLMSALMAWTWLIWLFGLPRASWYR